jgi:hypothetical protein
MSLPELRNDAPGLMLPSISSNISQSRGSRLPPGYEHALSFPSAPSLSRLRCSGRHHPVA